jgi:hypothetical protein
VLLLNECLLLFTSLSTQSGNFWIHPRTVGHNVLNFLYMLIRTLLLTQYVPRTLLEASVIDIDLFIIESPICKGLVCLLIFL